jgi:hypothetical protein
MAHGRIRWTPGNAARGLLTWAIDLWPYVNGKALLHGINLKEMEVSDMLDVVHYIFEEDSTFVSQEQFQSRDSFRVKMYRDLYERSYNYSRVPKKSNGITDFDEDFEDMTPVDPLKPPTKGYVPPTDFDASRPNPFGGVLDAPIG